MKDGEEIFIPRSTTLKILYKRRLKSFVVQLLPDFFTFISYRLLIDYNHSELLSGWTMG
jgi:hypothetical protein